MSSEEQQSVIMVTGGYGLIGHAIQEYVAQEQKPNEKWIFLSSKDGDLQKMEDTKAVFEKHRPTHVIHLAAQVGGWFKNIHKKVEMLKDNMAMGSNVIECCHLYKVQKLVSSLPNCIFPDQVTYPIDETMLHNGPPHPNVEGHAYAKRMVDILDRVYHQQYGCNFTCVIPTNVIGPHDNYHLEDSHVVPGLMHKFYLAKKNGTPMTVMGTGKPLRQFIYSADLAKLMVWVLREYPEVDPLILSVPEEEEVSIGDVARLIAKYMDFQGELIFDTTKSDGQFKKTMSIAKLQKYLPDVKFTPFEEAIKKSVEWFVENYETCRK